MKNLIIAACAFLSATSCMVHAQTIKTSMVSHGKNSKNATPDSGTSASKALTNTYLNEINTYAMKDFMQRFKNPLNVYWTKCEKGYIVACTQNGIKCRSAYDLKGFWVYTIKYYDEWKLPKDVRTIVKSNYFDYRITQVEEVTQAIKTIPTYVVHIEDDKTFKKVLVGDGEMVVMEEYNKQ